MSVNFQVAFKFPPSARPFPVDRLCLHSLMDSLISILQTRISCSDRLLATWTHGYLHTHCVKEDATDGNGLNVRRQKRDEASR